MAGLVWANAPVTNGASPKRRRNLFIENIKIPRRTPMKTKGISTHRKKRKEKMNDRYLGTNNLKEE